MIQGKLDLHDSQQVEEAKQAPFIQFLHAPPLSLMQRLLLRRRRIPVGGLMQQVSPVSNGASAGEIRKSLFMLAFNPGKTRASQLK